MERIRLWAEGRRGFGWLIVVLDVQRRFGELRGGMLAASVTLTAFLSLFPLLVVAVAVLGFVSTGTVDLPGRLVDALGIPPGGPTAEQIRSAIATAEDSRRVASVIGLAGLAWSGFGLVNALENTHDVAWQREGRGLKGRLFALAWLAGATVLFAASFAATAVLNLLPASLAPVGIAVGAALAGVLFVWSGVVLTNAELPWRAFVPGAIFGAIGFEILKVGGSIYVPRVVASASALYGTLGTVFALLAWLFFFGRLFVYAAVVNVVRWETKHGTDPAQIRVPAVPGPPPSATTRGGAVTEG